MVLSPRESCIKLYKEGTYPTSVVNNIDTIHINKSELRDMMTIEGSARYMVPSSQVLLVEELAEHGLLLMDSVVDSESNTTILSIGIDNTFDTSSYYEKYSDHSVLLDTMTTEFARMILLASTDNYIDERIVKQASDKLLVSDISESHPLPRLDFNKFTTEYYLYLRYRGYSSTYLTERLGVSRATMNSWIKKNELSKRVFDYDELDYWDWSFIDKSLSCILVDEMNTKDVEDSSWWLSMDKIEKYLNKNGLNTKRSMSRDELLLMYKSMNINNKDLNIEEVNNHLIESYLSSDKVSKSPYYGRVIDLIIDYLSSNRMKVISRKLITRKELVAIGKKRTHNTK